MKSSAIVFILKVSFAMCQSQTLWSADLTKNTASAALKTASKEMGNNGLKLDERVQVKDQHLLMHFPKGTFSKTQGPGSINSYLTPESGNDFGEDATLSYVVKFEPGFEFKKGGKLPGLFGGPVAKGNSCSGGKSGKCFSSRMMWRENGDGEAYIYLQNNEEESKQFCKVNRDAVCTGMGISVGRGKFRFIAGKEHRLRIYVKINSLGKTDGILQVEFDGKVVIDLNNIKWRAEAEINVSSVFFSMFFGGGDATWASPKDQSLQLSDMKVDKGCLIGAMLNQSNKVDVSDSLESSEKSSILTYGSSQSVAFKDKVPINSGSMDASLRNQKRKEKRIARLRKRIEKLIANVENK